LFVCIGNACRSQMAEAFARTYGSDVLIPASAGLYPASQLPHDTIDAMEERGINVRDHFPKTIKHLARATAFDLVINMSGMGIPRGETGSAEIRQWDVDDPVSMSYEDHCGVRDLIETLVMNLILELRRTLKEPGLRQFGSGRVGL
jgi:arsenate reductase (thioredoxin)